MGVFYVLLSGAGLKIFQNALIMCVHLGIDMQILFYSREIQFVSDFIVLFFLGRAISSTLNVCILNLVLFN